MIEKLFTSRTRVRIIGFLLFGKKDTHLREISTKLKISVSGIKREIDNLELLGLIKKENNNISVNEKCPILPDLKNIFIKTDFIFYPIKKKIKVKGIKFALIFGSFAQGNYSAESDIDLFIIGNIKTSKVYPLIEKAEKIIRRTINPVVWNIEELKKNKDKAFIKDIMKKKKIMLIGEENEFRRIAKC